MRVGLRKQLGALALAAAFALIPAAGASATGPILQYPVPLGYSPYGVVGGKTTAPFFTATLPVGGGTEFGWINANGAMTTTQLESGFGATGITFGPEGKLWMSSANKEKVVKVDISTKEATYYSVPGATSMKSITVGPDGNLWVPAMKATGIARITPTGTVTPIYGPGIPTVDVTAGSEGNVWYTSCTANKVGKVQASTGLFASNYSLPANSCPQGITRGPEGNIWFTLQQSGKIAKINTTNGLITEYPLPAGSTPFRLVFGPEGNVWYTNPGTNSIGRMTPTGTVTEFPLAEKGSNPLGIAVGLDKRLYFALNGTNKIGVMVP